MTPDGRIISPVAPASDQDADAIEMSRPLRVLHVVEAFGGGVLEVIDTLTRSLSRRGYQNAIAYGLRPETPTDLRARIDSDVELHQLPWGRRTPTSVLEAVWALPRLADQWAPDIVHLHSSFAGVVGAATIARSWPTAYSPHGYAFAVPRNRLLEQSVVAAERFVAHRVDIVAAVSESEADEARERAKAERVAVVANGIPELDDDASLSSRASKDRRVVASGRPVPQRQPVEAAQILAAVAEHADVAWIGGGYENGEGVTALRNAGIPMTGWLPKNRALDELDRAMVYIHWTAWDGLALSILEAMARDVVVVAHDIPSSREVIGPEQVCASPNDAVSLTKRILDDCQFREDLLSEQRRRRQIYGAKRMAQNWSALYATLAVQER